MARDQSVFGRLRLAGGKFYGVTAPYLAAFGLLNIYSHLETYQLFSKSVRWIVGWYHYFTSQIFSFVHLEIPQFWRDVLVIYAMLSFATIRGSGRVAVAPVVAAIEVWRNLGKSGRHTDLSYLMMGREGTRRRLSLADSWLGIVFVVVAIWTAFAIFRGSSGVFKWYVNMSIVTWGLISIGFSGNRASRWYMKEVPAFARYTLSAIALPMSWISGQARLFEFFLKGILAALLGFIALILFDFAFALIADPLSNLRFQLPDPPVAS